MEDGFWLFIILQLAALGPLAHFFGLTKFRRIALATGTVAAVGAALVSFTLAYVTLTDSEVRHVLEWSGLTLRGMALILTASALVRFK